MCAPDQKPTVTTVDVRPSTQAAALRKATMNYVDYEQPRREHLFQLPGFMSQWITENMLRRKEPRNMGIFLVGVNILLTSGLSVLALYYMEQKKLLPPRKLAVLGAIYTVVHLKVWARSFMLALHYITHCSIFNRRFRSLDHIWKAGICVLFGIPPGLYFPHHVAMHHSEDNVAPYDMSSTMDYDRSSRWNQFKYMFRFFAAGNLELPFRLVQMKKYRLALQSVAGSLTFAALLLSTLWVSPVASTFTLWLLWIIVSFGLMEGNFKEHIFVDPKEYDNNYKSAFSCINAPSNALTFNTGYHIEHHEEPGLPWYQLPDLFLKNLEKHAANDSLVFDGIGSMEVGNLVLKGDFETLADHYLNVGQPSRSRAQLIAEFKRRLRPVSPGSPSKK